MSSIEVLIMDVDGNEGCVVGTRKGRLTSETSYEGTRKWFSSAVRSVDREREVHDDKTNQLARKIDYWMTKISYPRYLQLGAYSGSDN